MLTVVRSEPLPKTGVTQHPNDVRLLESEWSGVGGTCSTVRYRPAKKTAKKVFCSPFKPLDTPYFCFPTDVLFARSFLGSGYILTAQQLGGCLPEGGLCGRVGIVKNALLRDPAHRALVARVFEAGQ